MQFAIFVDAENEQPHVLKNSIKKLTQRNHTIVACGVYGKKLDISRKWRGILGTRIDGVLLTHIDVPQGKNRADLEITMDITEMLCNIQVNDQVDGYLLITHDADYQGVIDKINEKAKKVIIAYSTNKVTFSNTENWLFGSGTMPTVSNSYNIFIKQVLEANRGHNSKISLNQLGQYLREVNFRYSGTLTNILKSIGYRVQKGYVFIS